MTQDKVRLSNGTVLLNVHTEDVCAGQHCCIHNPSQHHMLQWPGHWEPLFKQMWRTCPHNMEHPDPDDLTFHRAKFGDEEVSVSSLHGCDGCCQSPATPPEAPGKTIDERMAETTPVDLTRLPGGSNDGH